MAAQALTTPAPCAQLPANDNPPGKRPDKWRLAIDALKPLYPALAVCFAQARLAGHDFHEFCAEVLWGFGDHPQPAHITIERGVIVRHGGRR